MKTEPRTARPRSRRDPGKPGLRVLLALLLIWAGTGPLLARPLPDGSTPGPAFVDWKRGVQKQSDAARDARRAVEGGATADEVLELLGDPSGYVRDATFAAVARAWSDEQLLSLAPGLVSPTSLVAENVAELLGIRPLPAAAPLLERALGASGHEGARRWMLSALAALDPPSAVTRATQLLKREKRALLLRGEALLTLARHGGEDGRSAIETALSERKQLPDRLFALIALREVDPPRAFEAAMEQLTHPPRDRTGTWSARIELAALSTLAAADPTQVGRERGVAAIDLLLAGAEEATGRPRRARFEALSALTGHPLTLELLPWQSWWAARRETWEPGKGAPPEPGDGDAKRRTEVVTFHGVPVDSRRVVFLQDLSGGMARNLAGETGGEGPTRLDRAKDELGQVLGRLDDETWVNVITFASGYFAPFGEPQHLQRARRALVKFCREQRIPTQPGHARGNVYDALAFAVASPHVDTVYLVSEGAPTEGKYHDYDRFLVHFLRLNFWYGVRVHVLLVGETGGSNRAFVERLARSTGGDVHPVDGPPPTD